MILRQRDTAIFWQGKEGAFASLESSENIEGPVVLGLFTETSHF